jgi:hypothetical protein
MMGSRADPILVSEATTLRIQGAVIREQGVTFAVVVVKRQVLDSSSQATGTITSLRPTFGGIPTILMAQDYRGTPIYYGRPDIVRFLANVPLAAIPWKEYTIG